MEGGGGGAQLRQSGSGNEESDTPNSQFRWKPNEQCLELLLAMGIDRSAAIKGLYYTGNHSAEFAASYVFDHPDLDDDIDQTIRLETDQRQDVSRVNRAQDAEDFSGEIPHYKMVFVVNTSLGMDVGKTAAQVGHASVGLYRRLNAEDKVYGNQLLIWEEEGEKKVVLRGHDVSHLRVLEKQANALDLPTHLIQDSGFTDIPPNSVTVLAIFGRNELVNSVTGKLFLL